MYGALVAHGSHNGTDKVLIPEGMQVDLFTDENTPMEMSNLLALVAAGNLGIPLDTFSGGDELPNYHYDPFSDAQVAAVLALDHLPPGTPIYFVGGAEITAACNLCETPNDCPALGPHFCDGVLGFAERNGLTHLQLLACRTSTITFPAATTELIGEHGDRETTVHDQFAAWVYTFMGQTHAEQDTAWAQLPDDSKIYLAGSDAEMREWSECYEARTALAQATDTVDAAGTVASLSHEIRMRLLRDYPEYRPYLLDNVALSAAERHWIDNDFLTQDFETQLHQWLSLDSEQQTRYLAHDGMASWVAARTAHENYTFGLPAEPLAQLVYRLDPNARAILRGVANFRAYLDQSFPWALH